MYRLLKNNSIKAKMPDRKLIILIFLFYFSFSYTQKSRPVPISKAIMELSYKQDNRFINGKRMLELSTNDYERAKSYGHMADALRKNRDTKQAIQYFEKGIFYAKKVHFTEEQFTMLCLLSDCYSVLGIINKSEQAYIEASNIAKQENDPGYYEFLYAMKVNSLLDQRQFCEAGVFQKKILALQKYDPDTILLMSKENMRPILGNYIVGLNFMSFLSSKCNKNAEAKKYLELRDHILSTYQNASADYYRDMYHLAKAELDLFDKNVDSARVNFDKAAAISRSTKKERLLELILEERLNAGLDHNDVKKQQQVIQELLNIKQQQQHKSAEAITHISEKDESEISNSTFNIKLILIVCSILICFLVLGIYRYRMHSREMKKQFLIVIDQIEKDQLRKVKKAELNKLPQRHEQFMGSTQDSVKLISDDKEKEILEKLVLFESGTSFTNKSFTISNLAAILETNTKYTSYILKKHRAKNFNDYVNGLKIKFVLEKLYNEPKFRHYKISALSDLGGFSSQSRFAFIFKNEVKMAPSMFLRQLSQQKT